MLRALIDRSDAPGQYLLLGGASPSLLRQTSESLLGRVEVIEVTGFTLDEVGSGHLLELWLRGGYPRSYLATDEADSLAWRSNAVNRYVEQDLRQLGIDIAPPAMLRFWKMLAHYHAQIWNSAPFAQSMGVSQTDRTQVSGHTHPHLHGPPTPALARKRRQAAGQGSQNLLSR